MAKINPAKKQPLKQAKKKSLPDVLPLDSWIDVIIVLMYAMVELFPQLDAVDVMGSQWLYLSILNVAAGIYIINKKKFAPNVLLKSAAFLSLAGLLLISVISFFASYNVIESIVTYSRLLIAFIAFVNLIAIISSNRRIIAPVVIALALMVILQSLFVVSKFFSLTANNLKLDEIILAISGNTGNKNFLGVSILLKIPFVVYLFHRSGFFLRIMASAGIFISCLALFIINSRSTYIGLLAESVIFIAVMIYFFMKEKNRQALINSGIYAAMLLMSFGLTQMIFSKVESQKVKGAYGSVTERVESISFSNEGSSGRVRLWQSAVDFISKHPVLGGGYGNWKIHSVPYESTSVRGFGIRKHVHNDYLEVAADTGIIGGLCYAGFLFVLIFYCVKIIFYGDPHEDIKLLAMVLLMSHVAYMSDSMFNFPMERPNLFLLLFFTAASIIALYFAHQNDKSEKETNFSFHKVLNMALIALAVGTVYISVLSYKSMAAQNKVYIEWFGKTRSANPPFKSEEINPLFPSIPNLNELGMPIANMKAKYLAQEGKLDEALAVLNADKNSNPYLYFTEFTKANIALERRQMDSAIYYTKLGYYNRPSNQQLFDFLYDLSKDISDTLEMKKAFDLKIKTRAEASDYFKHSQSMFVFNKNYEQRISTLNNGLKEFPEDTTLNFQINFVNGLIFTKQSRLPDAIASFTEALKYQDNPLANQNVGFAYFNLGKFAEAIPYLTNTINSNQFNDGKTEYFRGRCFYSLNQLEKACNDFRKATAFGFPVEMQMLQLCK